MFDLVPFTHPADSMFDFFNHFDDDFFRAAENSFSPCRTDVRDEGNQYVVEAELPGFSKEEISLNLENGCMTLAAQHQEKNDQKDKNGNYIHRERRMNSLCRSFDVTDIDTDKISAKFENGVLTMQLPKKEATKPLPQQITIE